MWAQFDDLGPWAYSDDRLFPDGICLDAEGDVWVATNTPRGPHPHGEMLRVREGGEITHRFTPRAIPFACMLGGEDRSTLFVATSMALQAEEALAARSGQIEMVRVDVPGAGLP